MDEYSDNYHDQHYCYLAGTCGNIYGWSEEKEKKFLLRELFWLCSEMRRYQKPRPEQKKLFQKEIVLSQKEAKPFEVLLFGNIEYKIQT